MSERDKSDRGRSNFDMGEATLGATLKRARESRGLSIEDLARALRLEPRVIEHLESDNFDQLPAAAFVRGYLRAIAKQLDVSAESLIMRFDAECSEEEPPLSDFESRAPLQITSDSSIIRYTTIVLVVVMIVLVALWWRSNRDDFSMLKYLTETVDTSVPAVPATDPLPYTWDVVVHPDSPFYRAADPPGAIDAPVPATPAPSADIVIQTSADAWIQVVDVNGERLYYGLVTPGNEVGISGTRPYSLVVGNAPAVRLSFDGRPVNLLAHANEGVARLTLGETAAAVAETPRE